ncbi:MAG: hypothetical protein ACPGLV_00275 [Bacteroidia bacterium]
MKQSSDKIIVSKGPTLKLGLVGLLTIIGSGVLTYAFSILPAIPGFYFGLVMLLSIEGVVIDLKHKKIKPYFNFLLFKLGRWQDLTIYKQIILTIYSQQNTYAVRATQQTVKTKSFDIYLVDNVGNKLLIDEYTDYHEGLEFAEELTQKLKLPFDNQYEQMVENLQDRRRNMR